MAFEKEKENRFHFSCMAECILGPVHAPFPRNRSWGEGEEGKKFEFRLLEGGQLQKDWGVWMRVLFDDLNNKVVSFNL